MKILCLCSSLDLQFRYGCTSAWWQLFKGLYELGHDVIAVPYQGAAIESPWWRTYPNPCQVEGKLYSYVKKAFGSGATSIEDGAGAKVTKGLIESWVRPRWEARVADILAAEKDVTAVIVFNIPMNHITGLPERLRRRYDVPFFYYDGDVPASLPRFGGFASGFKIYEGADLSEYDGFMCNSEGGGAELLEMGARRVETVHWGVDPELYAPLESEQERDVFFYGYGSEYRQEWIEAMLIQPSRALPEYKFQVGGKGFEHIGGDVSYVGEVMPNVLRQACGKSRINLSITRGAHASVFASSTMRLFELAAMGCCVVSNPHKGIETWFDIGTEMLVVDSAEAALDTYSSLLRDEATRIAMGEAARRRVVECHTHRHRAEQIARCVASV